MTSTRAQILTITLTRDHFSNINLPLMQSVPDVSTLLPDGYVTGSAHASAGSVWRLYTGVNYTGRYIQTSPPPGIAGSIILSPGYPSPAESFLVEPRMNDGSYDQHVSFINRPERDHARSVMLMPAEIILYEHGGFVGRNRPLTGSVRDLGSFRKKTSSVIVVSGRWGLYTRKDYGGASATVDTGKYSYQDITRMIGNDKVYSVRLLAY